MTLARRDLLKTLGGAGLAACAPLAARAQERPRERPILFAHRGASALRPEHTLAAYTKAIADGADFVEPDLCITRDGVLVARHEPEISQTTDVAHRPEFAGRRTTRTVDRQPMTGWFVEDFTLAELKRLRAIERIPEIRPANAAFDGQFEVPTFDEIIDFVAAEASARGRVVGLIPELKHSTYFARAGLRLEDRFLATLAAHDYTRRNPVEIQSFEVDNLRALRGRLGRPANVRLMQLIDDPDQRPADRPGGPTYREMLSPAGLRVPAGGTAGAADLHHTRRGGRPGGDPELEVRARLRADRRRGAGAGPWPSGDPLGQPRPSDAPAPRAGGGRGRPILPRHPLGGRAADRVTPAPRLIPRPRPGGQAPGRR